MDNHPIPQDVTGFQFRLIGDMTLKQFAYLAAGVILGWVTISLPILFLIKFFFAILFAGTGAFLAFIPIGGRPADTMLFFFLKALFSPSQYLYQQTGGSFPPAPVHSSQKTFVKKEEHEEKKQDEKKEKIHFEAMPVPLASSVLQPPSSQLVEKQEPSPEAPPLEAQPQIQPPSQPEAQEQMLTNEVKEVTDAIVEAKKDEQTKQGLAQEEAHKKVTQLEEDLQTILAQKQALEQQLLALEQQLSEKKQQVFTPSTTPEEPKETSHVRKIPASMGTTVGTPLLNDVPNLLAGVIKDPRGNVLPNILIEVKDKDNNPVRAFKTNPLGQFASATPLLNGVYTITFEDPQEKQKFDAIEVTVNGEVMLPLEVISVDAREELRKELFGGHVVSPVDAVASSPVNSPGI